MAPLNNFLCERCGQTFSRIGKLYIHQEKPVQCPLCKEQFCSVHILRKHRISSCVSRSTTIKSYLNL